MATVVSIIRNSEYCSFALKDICLSIISHAGIQAVSTAIRYCTENGNLVDFLPNHPRMLPSLRSRSFRSTSCSKPPDHIVKVLKGYLCMMVPLLGMSDVVQ